MVPLAAFESARDALTQPLFRIGEKGVSLASLLVFVAMVVISVIVARVVSRIVVSRVLARTKLTPGVQYALGRFAQYAILVIGIVVSLDTLGVNVGSLTIVAGALGIGVGFGLQNVVNNFVSGLILLAERPVEVGDRIVIGGVVGRVQSIGLRSTTVLTSDNIAIIVPNADFVSKEVTNWTHGDPKVRLRIPIGVAYGTDERQVERALLEVAAADPDTLKEPAPHVRFLAFGESSLDFELAVWTETRTYQPTRYRSQLNFAIAQKLRDHGIEVPFPQRDLRLRSGSLRVSRDAANGQARPGWRVDVGS
jgi:small-conductance mechanosensitive channel